MSAVLIGLCLLVAFLAGVLTSAAVLAVIAMAENTTKKADQ